MAPSVSPEAITYSVAPVAAEGAVIGATGAICSGGAIGGADVIGGCAVMAGFCGGFTAVLFDMLVVLVAGGSTSVLLAAAVGLVSDVVVVSVFLVSLQPASRQPPMTTTCTVK